MKQILFAALLFTFSLSSAQSALDYAKIKDAEELNLAGMNIDTLPSFISSCVHLKRINLSGNRKIKVIDTFKKLSKLPNLKSLNMDYCNLFFLPSVIGEFKALKDLSLEGNGIEYLPVTFKNLPLEYLNISSNRIDSLNSGFFSFLKLETLDFSKNEGVNRDYNMDILATLPSLQSLILRESTEIAKGIGKVKNLQNLDLSKGSFRVLPSEISQLSLLRTLDLRNCSVDLSVAIELLAPLKKLSKLHIGDAKMTVVPFNISKLRSLNEMHIYLASLARLPISFKDLNLQSIYFHHCNLTDKKEFFMELDKINSLQVIYLFQCEISKNEVASKKQLVIENAFNDRPFAFNSTFNEIAKTHRSETPQMEYELLTSKVILTIKKQVSKSKFYFTIEPQYGYTEKYLDLFGDKIKAYPELKVYKEIHWEYTGSEMDADLLKMYALSEKTNKEKAKKKTTVEIYVLNLQDILIYPEKEEDTYIMAFSRGFDTLKIKTLPALSLIDAKKIQKWHKSKYDSYWQQRLKREERWEQLDKKYLTVFEKYEQKLEAYRNQLNEKFYRESDK
ncbi:MAG: leucine-rich repeat domain-containing protein [Bacteroidetes bacterium]|nr:leucine-rich repeat domain-containing protein [Bacteroidota bacterium]